MDLKKRLLSSLYPLGLAFLFLLVIAGLLILSINNSAKAITYETRPPIKVMEYFLLDIFNDNIFLANYLETTSYEQTVAYDKELQANFQNDLRVKREIEDLITAANFSNQRIIDYYQEAKTVHDDVILKRNEIITLHKESLTLSKNFTKEKQTLIREHQETFESARDRLSQIITQISLDSEEVQRDVVAKIQLYSLLIMGILIIFLGILIYRILVFSNEIIVPLQSFMDVTKRFSKGEYSVRASSKTKISEIKSLEKNINNVFRAIEENVLAKNVSNRKVLLKKEYHDILLFIKENVRLQKQTTITDLKNHLGVTHPTILSRLKFLEMKGYVKIVKIGREKSVELTAKSRGF